MLAVRFATVGDPSVIRVEEVAEPAEPTGDQLLVQVAASSVNGTDVGLRRGDLRIATLGRLPFTLGFDLAGTVLRCGPAVTAFDPGDQVVALLSHSGGAQAERVVIRQHRAALAPRTGTAAEAAALPLAGLTALQALNGRAGLGARPPDRRRVLVLGASGGIGSYAVLMAKLAGAHVTGTASAPKLDHVAGLGADVVVDRHEDDPLAAGERWDVILDTPGTSRFRSVRAALREDGVFVSTRPVSLDAVRTVPPPARRTGRRSTFIATRARSQDLAHLTALLDSGRLRSPVTRTYPAERAAQAHGEAGSGAGKVVIEMPDAARWP